MWKQLRLEENINIDKTFDERGGEYKEVLSFK